MLISETDDKIPSPEVFRDTLDALCAPLLRVPKKDVLPYIFAHDPTAPGTACASGWYSLEEFMELRQCSHLFADMIAFCGRKRSAGRPRRGADSYRLMLFAYLHTVESDYPPALLLNVLRFADGLSPQWRFPSTGKQRSPAAEFANQKFDELRALAEKHTPQLASTLAKLYKSKLRNAIAHSHFRILPEQERLLLTRDFSTISRIKRPPKLLSAECPVYTLAAIEQLWKSTFVFWQWADSLYRRFDFLASVEGAEAGERCEQDACTATHQPRGRG